ncbi:MAG TPA: hypothetical protein PKD59_07565 [Miltoncostaeaceae bacterium]|nr:hypothetical protein [Miltoncostaeaceae bacterium]
MSPAEYQALMLRSEALNQEHGLGAVPQGMTAAEYRALMLRSEALDQADGFGSQTAAAVTSHPTTPPRGFAWGAFGVGAAAMFGLALVAGGVLVRHRLPATRRGVTPSGTT